MIPDRRFNKEKLNITRKETKTIPNNVNFEFGMHDFFLEPKSGNFGAVDSMGLAYNCGNAVEPWLFQITVNESHGVNGMELEKLITKIKSYCCKPETTVSYNLRKKKDFTIKLFFVVPLQCLETFTVQSYSDGMNSKHFENLEQWVVGIKTNPDCSSKIVKAIINATIVLEKRKLVSKIPIKTKTKMSKFSIIPKLSF
jgi:hypothetical protein